MNKLIILDNGHGSNTIGKRSPLWKDGSQLLEYEFNRDIVKRVASILNTMGVPHCILVPELTDISLEIRVKRANELYNDLGKNACLFSIHANAGGGTGWECWTSVGKTKSDEYATILCNQFKKDFPEWKMRFDTSDGDPDKESNFYILKNTNCPAMLSENFFMDTEKDCRFIMSEEGRNRIARSHAEAMKAISKMK